MEQKLPHGPWKEIFYGEWTGYNINLYENPDKLTLILIYDKGKERETKGVIVLLNKYFVVEGDPSKFAEGLGGYSLVFGKYHPTFKTTYLIIGSGPQYSEEEIVSETVDKAFSIVEKKSEEVMEKSKTFGVNVTELKHAKEEFSARLFSEPTLLPGLVFRETPEKVAEKGVILGKKLDGSMAEENIRNFMSTVVVGKDEQVIQNMYVVLENCVLSGITGIVFDNFESFKNMGSPNTSFNYEEFPNLQPIGMPLKNLEPGQVSIDLNMIDSKSFREILGVPEKEGEYTGKIAGDVMDDVIEKKGFKKLSDLEEKLLSIQEEEKRFHVYRAIRWVKILEKMYPDLFGGKLDPRGIVSTYLKSMGSIVRINTKGLPLKMQKLLIYSTMRSLQEEAASRGIRAIICIPDAKKIVSKKPKGEMDIRILEVFSRTGEGVGFCIGADHDIDINPEIVHDASMRITYVSGNEAAVKIRGGRPYRVKIRPRLSA